MFFKTLPPSTCFFFSSLFVSTIREWFPCQPVCLVSHSSVSISLARHLPRLFLSPDQEQCSGLHRPFIRPQLHPRIRRQLQSVPSIRFFLWPESNWWVLSFSSHLIFVDFALLSSQYDFGQFDTQFLLGPGFDSTRVLFPGSQVGVEQNHQPPVMNISFDPKLWKHPQYWQWKTGTGSPSVSATGHVHGTALDVMLFIGCLFYLLIGYCLYVFYIGVVCVLQCSVLLWLVAMNAYLLELLMN